MFDIFRIEKVKDRRALAGKHNHNARVGHTPNADPTLSPSNELLMGDADTLARFDQVMGQVGKVRSNAVLAVEMLITASPEYFRDPVHLDHWKERVVEFLQDKVGKDRVLNATLHLDESTPHIHVLMVPLEQRQDGPVLNARKFFGGPALLAKWQDDLNSYTAECGLKRGLKGSKAEHTTVKQFYAAVNEVMREGELTADAAKTIVRPDFRKVELKQTREALDRTKSKVNELKEMADRVRETPLVDVLEKLGFTQKKGDHSKWVRDGQTISLNGSNPNKFFLQEQGKGGGGAIDLVMLTEGQDFKQAVSTLSFNGFAETVKGDVAAAAVSRYEQVIAKPQLVMPKRGDEVQQEKVRNYLTTVRKIKPAIVEKHMSSGRIFGDVRGNACFVLGQGREPRGAELRGTNPDFPFKGLCTGSTRDEPFTVRYNVTDPQKAPLVVCESAIDALSFIDLNAPTFRDGLEVVSAAGVRSKAPYLDAAVRAGRQIICAYDNDIAGDTAAKEMLAAYPNHVTRRKPKLKDWNEDLVDTRKMSLDDVIKASTITAKSVGQRLQPQQGGKTISGLKNKPKGPKLGW